MILTTQEFQSIVLRELGEIKTDIVEIKTDISGLKEDVSVLKKDVSGLKEDISVLKDDVSVLKEDVSVLKKDVSVLKEGQIRLEERQLKLDRNQFSLEKKVDAIYEQTAILTEFREETNTLLDLVMKNQSRTEIATAENWSDIAKIKSFKILLSLRKISSLDPSQYFSPS